MAASNRSSTTKALNAYLQDAVTEGRVTYYRNRDQAARRIGRLMDNLLYDEALGSFLHPPASGTPGR